MAGVDAVAHAETAPATVGVALVEGSGDGTATRAIIDVSAWASLAGTITAKDCDEWVFLLSGDAEDAADLLHDGGTTDRAEEPVKAGALTASPSEGGTAREATAATVRLGEDFCDFCDARIFLDFELLGDDVQESSADDTDERQDNDGDIHRGRLLFVVGSVGLYAQDEATSQPLTLGVETEVIEGQQTEGKEYTHPFAQGEERLCQAQGE